MLDLAASTADSFDPYVGARFRLAAPVDLEMELVRVIRRDDLVPPPGFRKPFVLLLRTGPGPILAQQIYRLENDRTGALEIFLIPYAADANGITYQAPFN